MYKKLILSLLVIGCLSAQVVAMGDLPGRVFTETPIMAIDSHWIPASLKISPDGFKTGMIINDGNGKAVVVNGNRQKKYDDVLDDALYFTPDSKHLAYIAREKSNYFLVYDGVEHQPYTEIKKKSLIFSPDSQHLAYVAKTNGQWLVIRDKTGETPFDDISVNTLKFSPDGKRLAYAAQQNGQWYLVEAGQTGKGYDGIRSLIFSPDNTRLAAVVRVENHFRVSVNGEESLNYESIRANSLKYSPDGKLLGFIAQTGDYHCVVINGTPQKNYRQIGNGGIIFSPTGERFGYTALTERGWTVVVDGQESSTYDEVSENAPIFSPNGKRVAFSIKTGNHWMVAVNGDFGEKYEAIGEDTFSFSPDSRHFAYVAKKNSKWVVPLDHSPGRFYDDIGRNSLVFGNHDDLVFSARRGENWFMVYNGSEGRSYDGIITGYGGRIFWKSGFGYQVVQGAQIYYISEKISGGDIAKPPIGLKTPMPGFNGSQSVENAQIYHFIFNPPHGTKFTQTVKESAVMTVAQMSMPIGEKETVFETSINQTNSGFLAINKFVSIREVANGKENDQSKINAQLKNAAVSYQLDKKGNIQKVDIQGNLASVLNPRKGEISSGQLEEVLRSQWEEAVIKFLGRSVRVGDRWQHGQTPIPMPSGNMIMMNITVQAAEEVVIGKNRCLRLEYGFEFDKSQLEEFMNKEIKGVAGIGEDPNVKLTKMTGYDLVDPATMLNYGSEMEMVLTFNVSLPNVGEQVAIFTYKNERQVDYH